MPYPTNDPSVQAPTIVCQLINEIFSEVSATADEAYDLSAKVRQIHIEDEMTETPSGGLKESEPYTLTDKLNVILERMRCNNIKLHCSNQKLRELI